MTDWLALIERAAYTRFCKTGSLEPFRLKRADLISLACKTAPDLPLARAAIEAGLVRIQVRVPVPSIGPGVVVLVDEWT